MGALSLCLLNPARLKTFTDSLGTPEGLCMHTGLELIIRRLRPQVFAVAEIDGARYTNVNNLKTPD